MTMGDFLQLAAAWDRLGTAVQNQIKTIFVDGAEVPLPELIAGYEVGENSLNSIADFLELVVQVCDVNDEIVMEADDVLSDIAMIWGAE